MTAYSEEWELFNINFKSTMATAKLLGLVKPYNPEIFKNIRDLYYNNIPAVILLLANDFVQENCYSRAQLLAYAFKDEKTEVIVANVDGLKLNPVYKEQYLQGKLKSNYKEHSYVRRLEDDGKYWIYDTSLGLAMEEHIYNSIQHPEIISISGNKIYPARINLRTVTGQRLAEKGYYIKDTIDAVRETCSTVREEYRNVLLHELAEIEKLIDANSNVTNNANKVQK